MAVNGNIFLPIGGFPIDKTHSSRRKDRIRKTKTDKVDTIVIAETLMMQRSYRFVTFYDLDLMDLKTLGRFRQKSIKQRTRLKIQLTSYVDQVFPELQYFFKSGLHQKSVYALLKAAGACILSLR